MTYVGWRERNRLSPEFRHLMLERTGFVPFLQQTKFFAACDGKIIEGDSRGPLEADEYDPDEIYRQFVKQTGRETKELPPVVKIEEGEYWLVQRPVTEPVTYDRFEEMVTNDLPTYGDDGEPIMRPAYVRALQLAPEDRGVFVCSLGSFKMSKSFMGGLVPAAILMVPGTVVRFVGMEYITTRNEFNYTEKFLMSQVEGLGLPDYRGHKLHEPGVTGITSMVKSPDKGSMKIYLSNGSELECRTYKDEQRQEMLKGEEVDMYVWSEYYQFPGIDAIVRLTQNLEIRKGLNLMPTTPDRSHIEDVKKRVASGDPKWRRWQGVYDVPRWENPYAFNFDQMMEDQESLSRQRWKISWEGKSGEYIGSTYNYLEGDQVFTPESHPELWKDPNSPDAILDKNGELAPCIENLDVPRHWVRILGVDTGTYHGLVAMVFDETGNVFFLNEKCNYRYIGEAIDRYDEITFPESCESMRDFLEFVGGHWPSAADWNSQYKGEFKSVFGANLGRGEKDPQLRTERMREYFLPKKAWMAPWLKVLPWEVERARYPDGAKGSPRRIDDNDHVMDPAEHGCAIVARERAEAQEEARELTPMERIKRMARQPFSSGVHPSNRGLS